MKLFTSLINTIKEHFRLKLIICFILCAILPLLILGTISYKISYNIAKDKILKETAISCEKNQHLLENRMTQISFYLMILLLQKKGLLSVLYQILKNIRYS